jgi:polar amino acid transport system substrate-binding protein
MKDRSSPQNGGVAAKAGRLAFVKRLSRAGVVALVFATAWSGMDTVAAKTPIAGIDAIRQRGVLRVAVLDEFPWLKERHGAGEPFEGPAWMIAKEAARRLHVRLVTVRVGFDEKLRILDESRADATIAPLLATAERTRQYGVVVYSQASQCLFGRAGDPKLSGARSLDDLNRPDVTIAVVKDAPQGRWLRTRLPSTKVIEIPGNITTVPTAEIVAGRADVATIDQYFFAATSRRTPGLASLPFGTSCLDSHELTLPIGLAVPKDRADLQVLFTHIVADRRARLASEQHRVVTAGP